MVVGALFSQHFFEGDVVACTETNIPVVKNIPDPRVIKVFCVVVGGRVIDQVQRGTCSTVQKTLNGFLQQFKAVFVNDDGGGNPILHKPYVIIGS